MRRTVGVDLAAEPAKTAVAVLDWAPDCATLVELRTSVTDGEIRALAATADRIGIDAPFGWPDAFVEFVDAHHRRAGAAHPAQSRDDRRALTKRRTDLVVQAATGISPLSVSADRIAHVALRCAGLLDGLGRDGIDVHRVHGTAVEAYPAAALHHWGLTHRRYKGAADTATLAELAAALTIAMPWLRTEGFDELIGSSHDALDALVVALIARAAMRGATAPPSAADYEIACREGWIHVPTCEPADLLDAGRDRR